MTTMATLPIVIPLAAAALTLIVQKSLRLERVIGIGASLASVAVAIWLLVEVDTQGAIVVQVGGWAAPIGISLVADRLAVLLLATSTVALAAVLVYAVSQKSTDEDLRGFHAVYQMLAAGVALALLTGDLFTLFVAFEIMLTASYVLLTHRAGGSETRATISYVVIGLVASGLLLTTIGLIYAVTGTVNIADLTVKLDAVPPGVRAGLGWLLFMVFGIKAALFPFFFWLPASYHTPPIAVSAVFAGLLTKVGVYALMRAFTHIFVGDTAFTHGLILLAAAMTMVTGVLGAAAQM